MHKEARKDMLFKSLLLSLVVLTAAATEDASQRDDALQLQPEPFETSHKRPKALDGGDDTGFRSSHQISYYTGPYSSDADYRDFNMNLLPTKERPELNPVLSALINEDVMKSIEAKRAIEQEELDIVRAAAKTKKRKSTKKSEDDMILVDLSTEATVPVLTTTIATLKETGLNEDINEDFVDQAITLEVAGSENNKKSRIEIKKGPNGQDYEYEYVYYYEDEDEDAKAKAQPVEPVVQEKHSGRAKTRYSNIERSGSAVTAASENSIPANGKAKGRSSSISRSGVDESDIAERLPTNTRFPSRGKNVELQPTPSLDSLENAAEKKKISVKRPSLELVDSDTFNTDEKQAKGARNGDTEAKPATAIEKERAAAAAAVVRKEEAVDADADSLEAINDDDTVTEKGDNDADGSTPTMMEKAAFDLYAILANENLNMMTTDLNMDETTNMPDTTDVDGLTTIIEEEPSSTSTTTSTTTTTTEATTTTTTTTTVAPALFGGKRPGSVGAGRNRFKLRQGAAGLSTSTTTEAPAVSEPTKSLRNRFNRPAIGRNRIGAKTTAAPESAAPVEEGEVAIKEVKEVKAVNSGFGRSRPRNRFNIRGSSTTEKPAAEEDASEAGANADENAVSSTTARTLRGRPGLNLRGRSRTTTTKAPAGEDEEASAPAEGAAEEKPAATPARPSRFGIQRAGANRPALPGRGKFGRSTTEAPATSDDSAAADSSQADVKGEEEANAEKTETEAATSSHRLKNRPHLNGLHKTESSKQKAGSASAPATPLAPRKVNPLLARRRLQLGHSTTEATPEEEQPSAPATDVEESGAEAAETDSSKSDAAEDDAETTTKQQARGLGLLGQRRRLPLRKPGTIL